MRALKGIRKGEKAKITNNLILSFSWLTAIANRLHVDIEKEVWRRFPALCSYCANRPCACKQAAVKTRRKVKIDRTLKPKTLAGFQKMFAQIYPPKNRTLAEGGMHLAEEIGEVTEAVHHYLGQYKDPQFDQIRLEIADYVSCLFGVANSMNISLADALASHFKNNCHVCHKAPCVCDYAFVARFKS